MLRGRGPQEGNVFSWESCRKTLMPYLDIFTTSLLGVHAVVQAGGVVKQLLRAVSHRLARHLRACKGIPHQRCKLFEACSV